MSGGDLLDILRDGISLAHEVFLDGGLEETVSFERCTGNNGSENTYAAAVNLTAIVSDRQEVIRTFAGELSQAKTTILFLNVSALLAATNSAGIRELDRITKKNGDTGPILAVGGFEDSETGVPVATKVYLG